MTHKITVAFSSLKLFLHLILTDLAREAMKLNFQYNFYVIWFPRNKVIIQIEFLDWLDMRSLIHTFVPSLNIMNYFLIWNFIMTQSGKKRYINSTQNYIQSCNTLNRQSLSGLLRKVFFYSRKSLPRNDTELFLSL